MSTDSELRELHAEWEELYKRAQRITQEYLGVGTHQGWRLMGDEGDRRISEADDLVAEARDLYLEAVRGRYRDS